MATSTRITLVEPIDAPVFLTLPQVSAPDGANP
jgi:hypothetical protein